MDGLLSAYPLSELFLLSLLAATLFPLGSEWLLAALVAGGQTPSGCIAAATLGNTLGAWLTYLAGWYGADWCIRRVLRLSPDRQRRAENFFNRIGCWSLLFSWLPAVGDPLCLVAGLLRTSWPRFLLPVFAGKLARYLAVAWLATSIGS